MDVYLKVLNWSLDTSKADALLARLPKPARNGSAITALGVARCCCSSSPRSSPGTGGAMKVLGDARPGPARSASCSRLVVGAALAYGVGQADRRSSCSWSAAAASPNGTAIMAARWNARAAATTAWRWSAPASRRCCSASSLFGTLPHVVLPAAERRLRAGQHQMAPGTTLKQTEAVADRVAAIVAQGPERRARVRARQRRQRPREHRAQEGPQDDEHRVRARRCRRRSPRSPTRASASRARTAAARTAIRATSCSISAATIRCS